MNNETMYNMLRAGKFKGHMRIILENVKTGHRDIFEDDNMATNALAKVFESNYNGCMDFYNLMPLKQSLGGVYLFWSALTESADNIYPPAQDVNKLSFYAGQTAHSTPNPYRGNPNGTATVIDANSGTIKFVWDWALEGAGEISAASLVHSYFGDCGLNPDGTLPLAKSVGYSVSGVTYFTQGAYGTTFDETMAKRYPMYINDNGVGVMAFVDGTNFKVKTVRHPWVKPSLIEGPIYNDPDNFTVLQTRVSTLSRSFTQNYTQIAQDATNFYVMERDENTATRLYVETINKSTMAVSSDVIDVTESLARPQMLRARMLMGIVSGGCIYWVSGSDAKTFVRIPIDTPANAQVLTSYLSANASLMSTPVALSDGLILGRNFLINGDYVYPVAIPSGVVDSYENANLSVLANYKNSPLMFDGEFPDDGSYSRQIKVGGMLVPYLATVNNLQNTVQKNTSQTMRCEYTVTFTEAI